MTTAGPSLEQTTSYYRAAFACLQYVECRRPTRRRFGPDADARWKDFQGHLSASDRIDLLLRDANIEWPGAFGAREVFSLVNVAEDEAFGADWPSLDPVDGEALWRELASGSGPNASHEAFAAVAGAWGIKLSRIALDPPDPAEKLIVVGPSAVAALAEAFVGRSDLDWAAQVTCVATPAADRHVALAASAIVDTHRAARVLAAGAVSTLPASTRVVHSDEALATDLDVVRGRA